MERRRHGHLLLDPRGRVAPEVRHKVSDVIARRAPRRLQEQASGHAPSRRGGACVDCLNLPLQVTCDQVRETTTGQVSREGESG